MKAVSSIQNVDNLGRPWSEEDNGWRDYRHSGMGVRKKTTENKKIVRKR